jgi:hypothetical protein
MIRSANLRRAALAAGALLGTVALSRPALAVASCSTLPSPIYAVGDSGPTPILAKIGTALSAATPAQTLVVQSTGSCEGVGAIVPVGGNPPALMAGTATYWDNTGTQGTCTLPIVGQSADVGIGGNASTECPGVASLPAGFGEFLGPIQSYDFIVPLTSSATSISAEAAYFVYGFGAQAGYGVAPWTDLAEMYDRNTASAATIIVGLGIGVPPSKFQGTDGKSDGNTIVDVASAGQPQAAIGFVSGEVADANRSQVAVLAYQDKGQSCGWYPSSTAMSLDRLNVRNGHYALWAPIRFVAAVDGSGTPTDPAAKTFIGYFTGTVTPPAGVDVNALVVESGGILQCAMQVQRQTDMGSLEPYSPPAPCDCFFEAEATGATSCQACTTDANCPVSASHCRFGYCEVN